MGRVLRAAAAYFAIAFLAGFLLGAVRTLLIAPRVGEAAAVALELPVMLAVSWFAARPCARRLAGRGELAMMGVIAFGFLMAAETLLGLVLGRGLEEQLAHYGLPAGALGLAGQLVFAAMPWLRGARRA